MKRTICIALLLTFSAAQASEWVSAGKSADGKAETFVDISSIKVTGDIRRMWLKSLPAPHSMKGTGSDSHKWMAYLLYRYEFNCEDETAMMEALSVYYEDGTHDDAPAAVLPSWDPVRPDTFLHEAMTFTCSWKPK